MKKSQFFSIYVLIHGLVLALVIGMGAAAFSMSSGLLILEAPTTATTSANTRGAMVSKIEAEKDKIKRAIKPVVGGCEIWDTFDRGVAAGYYRAKRWGAATASSSNVSDLTSCACPAGTTKTLLSHDSQPLTNISLAQDEWRFKYNINLNKSYPGSQEPPAGTDWDFALTPACVTSTGANSKFFLNRAGSLVATSTLPMNNIVQQRWGDDSEVPANYVQQIGYCYVYPGEISTGDCCCGPYCDLYPDYPEVLITDQYACGRAQAASQYYGINWDWYQWLPYATVYGWPYFNQPSGCGLSVYNHTATSTLPSNATTSVDKWICVAKSNYGWDNNWGLP